MCFYFLINSTFIVDNGNGNSYTQLSLIDNIILGAQNINLTIFHIKFRIFWQNAPHSIAVLDQIDTKVDPSIFSFI